MASRRIEHSFECSVDTFWNHVFFEPEYNRRLFIERLHFERWEQVSRTEEADGFRRVVEVVPHVGEIPAPIRGLLKDGAGYREEGQFIRSQSLYRLRAIPHTMAERVSISGELRVESIGPTRCRRIYTGTVEAKIFGVGSIVESRILDDVDKAYDRAAAVTEAWLKDTGKLGT